MDDRLGVARGPECGRAFADAAQLLVVVISREDDPDGAVLVGDRLERVQIDDAEGRMPRRAVPM